MTFFFWNTSNIIPTWPVGKNAGLRYFTCHNQRLPECIYLSSKLEETYDCTWYIRSQSTNRHIGNAKYNGCQLGQLTVSLKSLIFYNHKNVCGCLVTRGGSSRPHTFLLPLDSVCVYLCVYVLCVSDKSEAHCRHNVIAGFCCTDTNRKRRMKTQRWSWWLWKGDLCAASLCRAVCKKQTNAELIQKISAINLISDSVFCRVDVSLGLSTIHWDPPSLQLYCPTLAIGGWQSCEQRVQPLSLSSVCSPGSAVIAFLCVILFTRGGGLHTVCTAITHSTCWSDFWSTATGTCSLNDIAKKISEWIHKDPWLN